jgi:hypothetical protein
MKRLLPLLPLSLLVAAVACGDNKTPQPTRPTYEAGNLPQLSCNPNLDGKIDAAELAPALDVPVRHLVSPQGKARTVDLVGTSGAGGTNWDLGNDYADDQVATISATSPKGKWWASSFPGATFTAPFDAGRTIDAVYAYGPGAIQLLGLASVNPDGPGGKTLLVYDVPIAVFRFPLAVGATWVSAGNIKNATLRGAPYAGKDTYQVTVDGVGQLTLPDYTFQQVLRVRTVVTVEPSAGQVTTQRQTSFVFECFGEVARATSQANEPSDDFTNTSELRRLGL